MHDTGVDTKKKTTRIYCEQINSSLGTMLIEFGYVPKTARARFFPPSTVLSTPLLFAFIDIPEQGQL